MVDRAPLLDGRAVRAGRTRRDWRGHQSERAGPLYQRSACRGAGSRAAGVRRRRGDRESQPAGWQAGGGRARRPQGAGQGSAGRQPFRTTLAETWTGSYWWQGGIPVHTKEEAAVEAAAAPAMLCYVTRPDAVLMEVEVEAKANGEDCLNQVRTRDQVGTRPVPIGRGASERHRVPAGRRCGSAWGSAPQAPGPRPLLPVGVGRAAPILVRRERVGDRRGCARRLATLLPLPQARHFPRRRRPCTPAAGVYKMPLVGSLRGPDHDTRAPG